MRFSRQADPSCDPGFARWLDGSPKPKRALPRAQIQTVSRLLDAHRLSQSPGSAGEIHKARYAAIALHDFDTLDRFERPDQHSGANAGLFARDIHHPARTIGKINVGMASCKKKRAVSRRPASKSVRGRITNGIRFRLDDPPAHPPFSQIVDQCFSEQVTCEFNRIDGKLSTPKAAQGLPRRMRFG